MFPLDGFFGYGLHVWGEFGVGLQKPGPDCGYGGEEGDWWLVLFRDVTVRWEEGGGEPFPDIGPR